MKNTQFNVEVVFGDTLGKVSISLEQITKSKTFWAKGTWIIILV